MSAQRWLQTRLSFATVLAEFYHLPRQAVATLSDAIPALISSRIPSEPTLLAPMPATTR